MNNTNIVQLVLKGVALAMAVAVVVLGIIPEAGDVDTQITLLGIGLVALALNTLQKED